MNGVREADTNELQAAFSRLRVGRRVHGISAVLLPYTPSGQIDWQAFERHLVRTRQAGLDVAVNMDTGFGELLSDAERVRVLDATRAALGPDTPLYAGAFTDERSADPLGSYAAAVTAIEQRGGCPVIVQCRRMHSLSPTDKAGVYERICARTGRALAFELGPVFAPHGEIWDEETFRRILAIPQLVGAKHSSLDRAVELRRLSMRDALRPEFRIYTGNDLAIDMVAYGSDYLLGLSTFAPEAFAARDRAFTQGELAFLCLNDALQHLGNVAFRAPVPAYRHSAAQYLHLTGSLDTDAIHPHAPRRPAADRVLLLDCAVRLGMIEDPERVYQEKVRPYL